MLWQHKPVHDAPVCSAGLADVVLESTSASTAAPADQATVSTVPSTSSQQAPANLDALLSKLMELLLSFPNKSVAMGLAIKAASLLEEEQEVSPPA